MNRVIDEINTRLNVEMPQFKLTRRQVLIDRLFHDPRVQAAAEAKAQAENVAAQRVMAAGRPLCARNRAVVQRLPLFPHRLLAGQELANFLYRVRIGYADKSGPRRGDAQVDASCS